MDTTFHAILSWSELTAITLLLIFSLRKRSTLAYLRPVRVYIWIFFFTMIGINLISHFKRTWHFPPELMSNNFLYNLNSAVRLICFSLFFLMLKQPLLHTFKKAVFVLFILFFVTNFIFFEDFFYYNLLSGRLHSVETSILLIFCLLYYFYTLSDDKHESIRPPSFWVTTGLCIYVVINFPIYLFYRALVSQYEKFAINIWNVQNIAFVVFCCFLAKAFHEANKYPANNSTLQ
jgi:hypothetical protein